MSLLDQQLKAMPRVFGLQAFYKLRWSFDFVDGRNKYGGWNDTRQIPESKHEQMAWKISKEGLLIAAIQGEKIGEWTTKRMFEIDGKDYTGCRWVTAVNVGGWTAGTRTHKGTVIGLTMTSRDQAATVYIDGSGSLVPLTEYEKQHNKKEHKL